MIVAKPTLTKGVVCYYICSVNNGKQKIQYLSKFKQGYNHVSYMHTFITQAQVKRI